MSKSHGSFASTAPMRQPRMSPVGLRCMTHPARVMYCSHGSSSSTVLTQEPGSTTAGPRCTRRPKLVMWKSYDSPPHCIWHPKGAM